MNMQLQQRKDLEKKIAKQLLVDGIAAGYTIVVNNGETKSEKSTDVEYLLSEMFATDEERLIFYKEDKRFGWVFLVYGNGGWDVIADYTTNLQHIMANCERISDEY